MPSSDVDRLRPHFAPKGVVAVAAAKLLLHAATNGEYGFHRDELATLDDSRYLDWGYVAYPPLTPFIGRLAIELFGHGSVGGPRFFGALAISIAVVLTGLMARELGGRKGAQVTAALAVAIGPVALGASALFQYVAFDFLWWVAIAFGLLRLANSGDERWWVFIGVAIGLAVETKYTIGLGIMGIVLGVLAARPRDFGSKWLWIGVAASVAVAAPNLIWQARHDFISVEFLKSIHERDVRIGRTANFIRDQFTIATSPVTVPLWLIGLAALLRRARHSRERLLLCYVLTPMILFIVANGRGYYAAPLYPALFAAGAAAIETWLAKLSVSARASVRLVEWSLCALGAAAAAFILPMAPLGSKWFHRAVASNGDLAEEIGWPELVDTVARIHGALPAEERTRTAIFGSNYGEAGAINMYGKARGLPEAISAVNSYWLRGYGAREPTTLIVMGASKERLQQRFESCELAATRENPLGLHNEEFDDHREIYVCRGLKQPLSEVWKRIRAFG